MKMNNLIFLLIIFISTNCFSESTYLRPAIMLKHEDYEIALLREPVNLSKKLDNVIKGKPFLSSRKEDIDTAIIISKINKDMKLFFYDRHDKNIIKTIKKTDFVQVIGIPYGDDFHVGLVINKKIKRDTKKFDLKEYGYGVFAVENPFVIKEIKKNESRLDMEYVLKELSNSRIYSKDSCSKVDTDQSKSEYIINDDYMFRSFSCTLSGAENEYVKLHMNSVYYKNERILGDIEEAHPDKNYYHNFIFLNSLEGNRSMILMYSYEFNCNSLVIFDEKTKYTKYFDFGCLSPSC